MTNLKTLTAADALRLVVGATFRPFTKMDWNLYSGCDTFDPRIVEIEEERQILTIILDGGDVSLITVNKETLKMEERLFRLS